MIEISYEALFALAAFCAGAGYVLGKDIHKKKVIVQRMNDDYFF